MTREQLDSRIARFLGELFGSPGYGDPFSRNEFIDDAVEWACQATDCFYTGYASDITAGQPYYCAPRLYRLKKALVQTASGKTVPLTFQTMAYGIDTTTTAPLTTTVIPQYFMTQGRNRVIIWPIPNYAMVGGLLLEGFGFPLRSPATGNNAWSNDTDECPLPEEAQQALVYKACALRCLQFGDMTRLGHFEALAREAIGKVERSSRRFHAGTENAATENNGYTDTSGLGFDPLSSNYGF